MINIVLATRNKNKIREFKVLFDDVADLDVNVLSLDDIGFYGDIEEGGETFEENAIIKASVASKMGYIGIADDSGLCVDALGGAPGVYSARFSGGNDEDNNDLLLEKLNGKENRNAKYVCASACVFPDHSNDFVVSGECHGQILEKRHGTGGFGYDPLFYFPEFDKTFAEIDLSEKNKVSHRAIALRALVEKLKKVLPNDK